MLTSLHVIKVVATVIGEVAGMAVSASEVVGTLVRSLDGYEQCARLGQLKASASLSLFITELYSLTHNHN